jgi:hypothetical protein
MEFELDRSLESHITFLKVLRSEGSKNIVTVARKLNENELTSVLQEHGSSMNSTDL